ncbi:hypothetical protein [Sulfurimonas sp. HSL3-7]|uniref:hypothetical protein n=1 Tax=Sulfonitrofixus jiaomeiensis TaxID=3131938 RepID=UPI0031F7A03D
MMVVIYAHAADYRSDLSLEYINYDEFSDEAVLSGNTKLTLQNDLFTTNVLLEYLYSSEYKDRRYILLNEFYVSKAYEEYSFTLGKVIRYWGELEGFNIADVYNQKNYLLDPFDKSAKLGSWGFFVSKYFDESRLEFGVRFYEEDQKYPSVDEPYSPFLLDYDDTLLFSDGRYTPTLHLMYSFTDDTVADSETKIILLHGYDNKRYFKMISQNSLSQYAYRVNKVLLLSNVVYKSAIFKCEAGYTDVIRDDDISDYTQLSFGAENGFYDIFGADISVYAEYYRYLYRQEKIENVDISEIYDNDIFIAFRLDLNDPSGSQLKGGVLYDIKSGEQIIKAEGRSRIVDNLVLNCEYLQPLPSENTLLSQLGETRRVVLGLTYTF